MIHRKRVFISMLALIFIFCIVSCVSSKQKLGEQVVAKIDKFRELNGKLPESLDEVGIQAKSEDDPPVYYKKQSGDHYIVWYGLNLGESMTYDSQTKKWEDHN